MMNGLTQLGVKSATGFLNADALFCVYGVEIEPVALFWPKAERVFCLEVFTCRRKIKDNGRLSN